MKKYIIIGWCGGMGGGQVYTRNKCVVAKKLGYIPIVLHSNYKDIKIQELKKYNNNRVREIRFIPSFYSTKERERILNQLIDIVNPQDNDEFFIESNDAVYSLWGELLAKRLGCKNYSFLLEYFFSRQNDDIEYFKFKAKRHELAGIMRESLLALFGNDYKLPDEENTVLSAFSTNSVEDIPIPFELDTSKYDVVVGNIGRITKPYVQWMSKDLCVFANEHKDKTILLLLVGGEPGTSDETKIKETLKPCKNVDIFSTGFLFPIPQKLLGKIHVATATSGCIITALKVNLVTVGYRDDDNYPSGICGYDLKIFPPPDVPIDKRKKLGDYLNEVLYGDFLSRYQFTPYLDEGDHAARWQQLEEQTKQMLQTSEPSYYDTTKILPRSVFKKYYIKTIGHILPLHIILELVEKSGILVRYHELMNKH